MRILITGGGCREAIDGVRCVTNFSTGRTSAELAAYLLAKKNAVTLVTARGAILPPPQEILDGKNRRGIKTLFYTTGKELAAVIKKELSLAEYDAVIHAAAVSDYIPDKIILDGKTYKAGNRSKLPSGGEMTVTFKPAPKIASSIKRWAAAGGKKDAKLFCFKLTNGAKKVRVEAAVEKVLRNSKCDYVIANDLSKLKGGSHPFKVYSEKERGLAIYSAGKNIEEMAEAILTAL